MSRANFPLALLSYGERRTFPVLKSEQATRFFPVVRLFDRSPSVACSSKDLRVIHDVAYLFDVAPAFGTGVWNVFISFDVCDFPLRAEARPDSLPRFCSPRSFSRSCVISVFLSSSRVR